MNQDPIYNDEFSLVEESSQNMVTLDNEGNNLSPVKIPQCLLDLLDSDYQLEAYIKPRQETELMFYEDSECNSYSTEQYESEKYPPDFDESGGENDCDSFAQLSRDQMLTTVQKMSSTAFRNYLKRYGVDLQETLDLMGTLPHEKQQSVMKAINMAQHKKVGMLKKQYRKLSKGCKK